MDRVDRILTLVGVEPLPISELAVLAGIPASSTWVVVTKMHDARWLRIAAWLTQPGNRSPLYALADGHPDAPRPPPLTATENDRNFSRRLREDPERLARHRAVSNEAARKRRAKIAANRPPRVLAEQAVREAAGRFTVPVPLKMIAARAGVCHDTARKTIRAMLNAEPRELRIAGWSDYEGNGRRAPLYDTQVDLPDVPYVTVRARAAVTRVRKERPRATASAAVDLGQVQAFNQSIDGVFRQWRN